MKKNKITEIDGWGTLTGARRQQSRSDKDGNATHRTPSTT